jgi:hypothetical protein
MADRVTRPSNAIAHPGLVDCNPTTRRSKEEILAEKKAKAAAKAQAEKEKKANISKIAAIEKAEKQKAKDMDQEANDPVDPATQTRARRTRKRPDSVDEGNHHKTACPSFAYTSCLGPAKMPAKKTRTDTSTERHGQRSFSYFAKLRLTMQRRGCRCEVGCIPQ